MRRRSPAEDGFIARPGTLLVLAVLLAALTVTAGPAAARTRRETSLTVAVTGLPLGQRGAIEVRGPGVHRSIVRTRTRLKLRTGTYILTVKPVTIGRRSAGVGTGAVAYPALRRLRLRLRAGGSRRVTLRYVGVVNPDVSPLPQSIRGVIGDPANPKALLFSGSNTAPRTGTIFTSGPSTVLPTGLVSKVTGSSRQGSLLVVSVRSVSVAEATPLIDFQGRLTLTAAGTGRAARNAGAERRASPRADTCSGPSILKPGMHLDGVELRQASLSASPRQLRIGIAVRTTASLGLAAAAVGINCDWTLGNLGPYQAELPVGPVIIPVYATFPLSAGIHVNGTLNIGKVSVTSTTVASAAAGTQENSASLSVQGANVSIDSGPSLSGSAKLSAQLGMQAGIGVAKVANVHVEADFGPVFSWTSGQSCMLRFLLGSLHAGVTAFGKTLTTPAFAGFQKELWSGCGSSGAAAGGGGSAGGGASSGEGGGASGTTPERHAAPPGTYTHFVYHTCANGACGLKLHTAPTLGSPVTTVKQDGDQVDIVCQTRGDAVSGADGSSSNVWDRLYDGSYAADFYVDTPGTLGSFSPPIPQCDAPASPPSSPTYYVHHVVGTCGEGACGLKKRAGPGYTVYAQVGIAYDGNEIDIVCQMMGETVNGRRANSAVWDKLTDGSYVSDYYTDTPNVGTWSPPIPQC